MSHHISAHIIVRSTNYYLCNLAKTRKLGKQSYSITFHFIQSLVFSRFRYSISLFSNIPILLPDQLESVQHRSVRILLKLKLTDHYSFSNAIISIGWFPAKELAEYTVLCVTHRAIYFGQSRYLSNLQCEYSARPQRSTSQNALYIPRSNSIIDDRSFF